MYDQGFRCGAIPVIMSEGRSNNQYGRRSIANCFNNYIKKGKYLGVDLNLHEHVFKANKHGDLCWDTQDRMFTQPCISSLMDWSNIPSKNVGISKTWLLVDSQSTIDVLYIGELFSQIHKRNITLKLRCNAGWKLQTWWEHFSRYKWWWFYPEGTANILLVIRARERYRVNYIVPGTNAYACMRVMGRPCNFRRPSKGCITLIL